MEEQRLVCITFTDDYFMMHAFTNMTDAELDDAYCNEEYDEEGMDIEMKMVADAEKLGKHFNRVEAENVKL